MTAHAARGTPGGYRVRPIDVERIRAGDPREWELFTTRYADTFHGIAFAILRNKHDADEAVQAAYLSAMSNVAQFTTENGEPGLRAWVTTIARHEALAVQRRKTRHRLDVRLSTLEIEAASGGRDTWFGIPRDDFLNHCTRLGLLDAQQVQVLRLKYWDGLTDAQISGRIGKSTEAVQKLRYRTLVQLKDHFHPAEGA